jgi:hypothetical protein
MRGSPVLRTLIVLAVLLLTGLALARLTRDAKPSVSAAPERTETAQPPPPLGKSAAYELILSAQAAEITLGAGGKAVSSASTAAPLSGTLEVPGENPVISLRIKWADNSPGHRFAKLRLEVPGKDTLEHVFSAPGDIDDIWEP